MKPAGADIAVPAGAAGIIRWEGLPEPVRFALERLERGGFEAAIVGGCVRDTLLGRPVHDYDIASSATPEAATALFEGETVVPTGIRHGTVTLVRGGMALEITSFRQDGAYSDLRRPDSVSFGASLREDVLRRDFTMNAIAWERGLGILDHVGGREDMARRRIRAVGEAHRRFGEDALRILRALRFASQLGWALEEETAQAVRDLYLALSRIAAERVRAEMGKLLRGDAAPVLRAYPEVLRLLIPAFAGLREDQAETALARLEAVSGRGMSEEARWAALLLDAGEAAAMADLLALRAENDLTRGACVRIRMAAAFPQREAGLRRLIGQEGPEAVREAAAVAFAFAPAQWEQAESCVRRVTAERLPCSLRDLPVSGRDMLAAGLRGKEVGRVLETLLEDVLEGRVPNEREALLRRAGGLAGKGAGV